MLVFCLAKTYTAVSDVLPADARRILTPASGVAQQIECQASLRAKRVPFIKLLNFLVSPSVASVMCVVCYSGVVFGAAGETVVLETLTVTWNNFLSYHCLSV